MEANRLITILVLLCIAIGASAKKKQEYPRAEIKVEYNYFNKFLRGSDGVVEKNTSFILLANRNKSKFYCPSTEYRDSLLSTPSGRAKERQMFDAAATAYVQNRDRSAMDGVVYHSRLYVIKDLTDSVSTTYDQAGMGEYGYYDEPFSEIDWMVAEDSTKTILNYQCIMAATNYHGRKLTVWFTPEIPMQDDPWKFGGLPGFILEAMTADGKYSFVATGIQQTTKAIGSVYLADEYEKTNRKSFLKSKRAYLDNPLGSINAQMGGDIIVTGNSGKPIFASSDVVDLIETDYK